MAMNKGTRPTRTRRKTKPPTVMEGEPNPSAPKQGHPTPMPSDPSPVGRYNKLKKAFNKPGMQPGEKEAIAAISKKRGVSLKRAAAIGKMRTGMGLTTAGISGPKGVSLKKDPARAPVKNPRPLPPSGPTNPPPYDGPRPKRPPVKSKKVNG